MISLKLSSHKGQERISLSEITLFSEFLNTVSEKTSIRVKDCQVSAGYPPKVIYGESGDVLSSFSSLSNGSVVLVREGQPASLKVANGARRKEIVHLMSMGFPLTVCEQALEIAGDDLHLAVEVSQGIIAATVPKLSISEQATLQSPAAKKVLARRVINADNSCLFNALGYLIKKERHKMGPIYRQVIADEIQSDTETYSPDILGQTTEEYIKWILNPEKWGGEIEMNILSKHLQIEIAAVDIQTGKLYIYGENSSFLSRVYLLYDGIHYDAIVSTVLSGTIDINDEANDITIFEVADDSIALQVQAMAAQLRDKKQFVNMAGCDIQCLICLKGLKGQKEAQAHAKETGHQNFGQIDV